MRKVWMLALVLAAAPVLTAVTPSYADGTTKTEAHNYTMFSGKVTAVNAANSTITITNKAGESQTFTVPADAKVKVNGAPSTLAAVAVDMKGGVKTQDGAVVMVKAWTPGAKEKPKA